MKKVKDPGYAIGWKKKGRERQGAVDKLERT